MHKKYNLVHLFNQNAKSYVKWTDKQRFDIGKYAAENGNANAVRKFKAEFATLTESTVRTFKKKYFQLNEIPVVIRELPTISRFKKDLKEYLKS